MRCEAGCFKPSSRQLPHAWLLGGGSGLESYFPQSEVSLVLGVMTDFQLKPGHFRHHVTRLWVFLKHGTVPAGQGAPPHYGQAGIEVQVPHVASTNTQGAKGTHQYC